MERLTDDELASIERAHEHVYDEGISANWYEENIPRLVAEFRRLRERLSAVARYCPSRPGGETGRECAVCGGGVILFAGGDPGYYVFIHEESCPWYDISREGGA